MARRMITSDIWLHERFGHLPLHARVLFIGMITNADDEGRIKASPSYLRALVFPYDDDVTADQVKEWRDAIENNGFIATYQGGNGLSPVCPPVVNQVSTNDLAVLLGWNEHQQIRKDRRRPSSLQTPPEHVLATMWQPQDNLVSTTCPHSIVEYSRVKYSKGTATARDDKTPDEQELSVVANLYEQNIGMLTPIIAEQLIDAVSHYPKGWIGEAVKLSVEAGVRRWKYIEAILQRWDTEGKDSGKKNTSPAAKGNKPVGKLEENANVLAESWK